MTEEVALAGGQLNPGAVVRVGDTVRRPRAAGAAVVEALLVHLEDVGFAGAPRFRGIDDHGRQILQFVQGDVHVAPAWQYDDRENAVQLGRLAGVLRSVHEAASSFVPPDGVGGVPQRSLPLAGSTWTHGDPGYPNVVYREGLPVALIDWEFAAPADPLCDPAGLLLSVRLPKPNAPDNDVRRRACELALNEIADTYGMTDEQRRLLPSAAACVFEDAADFWAGLLDPAAATKLDALRWQADWLRVHADQLVA